MIMITGTMSGTKTAIRRTKKNEVGNDTHNPKLLKMQTITATLWTTTAMTIK